MDRDDQKLTALVPDRHGYRTPEEPGAASPSVADAIRAAMDEVAHAHGGGANENLASLFIDTAKRHLRGGG